MTQGIVACLLKDAEKMLFYFLARSLISGFDAHCNLYAISRALHQIICQFFQRRLEPIGEGSGSQVSYNSAQLLNQLLITILKRDWKIALIHLHHESGELIQDAVM